MRAYRSLILATIYLAFQIPVVAFAVAVAERYGAPPSVGVPAFAVGGAIAHSLLLGLGVMSLSFALGSIGIGRGRAAAALWLAAFTVSFITFCVFFFVLHYEVIAFFVFSGIAVLGFAFCMTTSRCGAGGAAAAAVLFAVIAEGWATLYCGVMMLL